MTNMTNVGINGMGRIGKTVFIQLLNNPRFKICAINATDLKTSCIKNYLKNDSAHKYVINGNIEIIDDDNFSIDNQIIHIFRERDPSKLDWKSYSIDYVIDATGVFLTSDSLKAHDVPYVIMTSNPKDSTPLYVYGVNQEQYKGENIVSNSSCTSNAITPVLKFLDDKYGILNGNFTTIHSTTASQYVMDISNGNSRINRSVFNNIIPYTTGASKSIFELIPPLKNKIYGTSIRVPTSDVSIIDLNVELKTPTSLDNIMNELSKHDFILVNSDNAVSSDFLTTTCPSIVDKTASMPLGENRFKLMIWYDNEWSYSAQVIKLLEVMEKHNKIKTIDNPYFIENYNFKNKKVILRVDWNVPTKDNKILDDFRITSSLSTIKRILADSPQRIVIVSHFGRPKGYDAKYSWAKYIDKLQTYFSEELYFLKDGLSWSTLDTLERTNHKLYMLENIRFHNQETNYKDYGEDNVERIIMSKLGDFYVNDAFGCSHRDHLSICGVKTPQKAFGYLINSEMEALKILVQDQDQDKDKDKDKDQIQDKDQDQTNPIKVLAIIGGAKMDDKLPLLEALSKMTDNIYIGGGNINSIIKDKMSQYIDDISKNRAKIHLMKDGFCSNNTTSPHTYCFSTDLPEDYNFYDIGMESLSDLEKLINENDIIFWNGSMGLTEHNTYKYGSIMLFNLLLSSKKKVIIAGGNTVQFVNQFTHNFYYVSTGGGSSIEYISNGSLVGLDFFK